MEVEENTGWPLKLAINYLKQLHLQTTGLEDATLVYGKV